MMLTKLKTAMAVLALIGILAVGVGTPLMLALHAIGAAPAMADGKARRNIPEGDKTNPTGQFHRYSDLKPVSLERYSDSKPDGQFHRYSDLTPVSLEVDALPTAPIRGDEKAPDLRKPYIVYWRQRVVSTPEPAYLSVLAPDISKARTLSDGWKMDERPDPSWLALSPDRRQLAYAVRQVGEAQPAPVHLMSVADGKPGESLGVRAHMWYWSPDGTHLLLVTIKEDGADKGFYHAIINVAKRTTRAYPLPAAKQPADAKHPAGHLVTDWSRDGRWLLTTFFPPEDVEKTHLCLVKMEDGEVKRIDGTEKGIFGRFSPDGKNVLYRGPVEGALSHQLYVAPVGSGKPRPVEHTTNSEIMGYTWSPDGKQIAYTVRVVQGKQTENRETESFLMIVDADGRNSRSLLSEKAYSPLIQTLNAIDWR